MLLDMHGMQYGLSHHNKILQNVEVQLVVYLMSNCNIKWAAPCYIVLP